MKMSNEHYPYLCGGILLNLLIEAKITPISSREKLNGKRSTVSDSDILKGLIKLITGEEIAFNGDTLKKITTQYKKCEINGNSYITFTDSSTVNAFYKRYTNNYNELLEETSDFINTYLSESKLEDIVKSIIELIIWDKSIPDETKFTIFQNVDSLKKSLSKIDNVEIEVFLINVIFYIIKNREVNTIGSFTFYKLFKQNGNRGQWKLSHPLGKTIKQNIKINRCKNISINTSYKLENLTFPDIKTIDLNYQKNTNNEMNENNITKYCFDDIMNSTGKLYNLIVGGIENAVFKNTEKTYGYFIMKKERILNLFCDELIKPLSILGIKERNLLTSLPTIFAIDQGPNGHKDGDLAHYGYIKKINVLNDSVKIVFELRSSFSQHELYKNNFELEIEDFELYTTHWAVKEVDLEYELSHSDINFF